MTVPWPLIGAGLGFLGGFLGSDSGDADVNYESSPEQQAILQQLMPLITQLTNQAQGGAAAYQIPNISGLMPSTDWYNNISQGMKDAAWEPYQEGMNQLENTLSGRGSMGSARAGMSGAAADVMSDYTRQASSNVTNSLWNMTSPGLQAGWQALLQQQMMPYSMMTGMTSSMLPTGFVNNNTNPFSSGILGGLTGYSLFK